MIGRTLGHYRIESKLGEGGMGVVYKAHDSRLGRPVAIKILPPDRLADSAGKQRFIREARAASALNHPGIVTIHDVGSEDGMDFIVMEYIDGRTLDALIAPKGMPAAQMLRHATQIAGALAAAHGAGILHRDLKPSNVMITVDGRTKILDFGVAKLLEPADSQSGATTLAAPLTEDRVLVGTAAYMSPEQAEGRKVDARSDIFSFGIVLYEMATGLKPFTGDSRLSLLSRIVNDDPKAPREIVTSVPPELERVVLRCLRKDPARRFQTTADLAVALEDVQAETASGSRAWPSARAGRPSSWAWTALAIVIAAAGYAGLRMWRATPAEQPLRASALTTLPGEELYPSLSPDGDHVVFTWTGPKPDGTTDVYVQQIGAGSPLRLTSDPLSDHNPVWSPDGRWIAFLRGKPASPLSRADREVRLIAPLGGPERKLADVRVQELTVNPAYLAWCPDSTCLVVTDTLGEGMPDALFVISLDTGDKRRLTNPQPPVAADTNPVFSPDGSSLLFLRRATWSAGEPHVVPVRAGVIADGDARHLAAGDLKPDNGTWLPDGRGIVFSAGAVSGGASLWRLPVTGAQPPARLPFVGEDGVLPAVSRTQPDRSARLVYVRSFTDDNIWRVDIPPVGTAAPPAPVVAIASTKADIHPAMSPDGRRVAFTSTRSGTWEIWVSDRDGANAVQITSLRAPTGTGVPDWSPDGQLLTFASDAEGQFEIFVVPSAGGRPRNITSHQAFDHVPSFSSNGQWIYFSSTRSGRYQVWKVPVSGGTATQVTTEGGWGTQESADGADLYFTLSPELGASNPLWRMPTAGGQAVRVLDTVLRTLFAVLDGGIYYLDQPSAQARLQYYDFATRRSVTVARDLGDGSWSQGLTVSPDGRTVLFARRDASVDDLMLVDDFR
jgi:eukaryotic-like serine/threonine-protein kinase